MHTGMKIELVGDRYGHNSANDVQENLGKRGVVGQSPIAGFWWVTFPDGSNCLAYETEMKEIQ